MSTLSNVFQTNSLVEIVNGLSQIVLNIQSYSLLKNGNDWNPAFTKAFQDLRDAGGGTLDIPNGDYLCSSGVFLYSNTTVRGSGLPRIYTTESAQYESLWRLDISGCNNVTIKGIKFDQWTMGNFKPTTCYTLTINNFTNVTIEDCIFQFVGIDCLMVASGTVNSEPLFVRNNQFLFKRLTNQFYDCSAMYLNCGKAFVENNLIKSINPNFSGFYQWKMQGGCEFHTPRINVSKNVFEDCYAGINAVPYPNGFSNVYDSSQMFATFINDNTFNRCKIGVLLFPDNTPTASPMKNYKIHHNVFNMYHPSLTDDPNFYYKPWGAVATSTIPSTGTVCPDVSNFDISNNTVTFTSAGSLTDADLINETGRQFQTVFGLKSNNNLYDVKVHDNSILNYPYTVLNIESNPSYQTKRVEFYGNTVKDCGRVGVGGGASALFVLVECDTILIERNRIVVSDPVNGYSNLAYIGAHVTNSTLQKNDYVMDKTKFENYYLEGDPTSIKALRMDMQPVKSGYYSPMNVDPQIFPIYSDAIPAKTYYQNDLIMYYGATNVGKRGYIYNVGQFCNLKTYGTINATYLNTYTFTVDVMDSLQIGDTINLGGSVGSKFGIAGIKVTATQNIIHTYESLPSWTGTVPMTASKIGDPLAMPTSKRGVNVSVSSSATTLSVTFSTAETDSNYAVSVSPAWNTTYWIIPGEKSTTGFTIHFGTAPSSATTLDWTITR